MLSIHDTKIRVAYMVFSNKLDLLSNITREREKDALFFLKLDLLLMISSISLKIHSKAG